MQSGKVAGNWGFLAAGWGLKSRGWIQTQGSRWWGVKLQTAAALKCQQRV